jgi:hypothetical protein
MKEIKPISDEEWKRMQASYEIFKKIAEFPVY